MKKFTGFIAAAAIAIAPMSASALTALTDNAMNDVTGQAGVSIAIDDVVMETWVGETKYTDTDGTYVAPLAGSLVISNKHTVKFFNSFGANAPGELHSPGKPLMNATVDAAAQARMLNPAHALTIDIGICESLSAAEKLNTANADALIGGVVIGLPTLEIYTSSDEYTVGYVGAGDNSDSDYIQITTGEKIQHILGGVLEIAPH